MNLVNFQWSLLLVLGSRDLSQAEKKMLLQAEQIHKNGPRWKMMSFWVKIVVILWVALLVTRTLKFSVWDHSYDPRADSKISRMGFVSSFFVLRHFCNVLLYTANTYSGMTADYVGHMEKLLSGFTVFPCVPHKGNYINPLSFRCMYLQCIEQRETKAKHCRNILGRVLGQKTRYKIGPLDNM
jgi:hypothetical protein